MTADKKYCMNSYLKYRTIVDHNMTFAESITPYFFEEKDERVPVDTAEELDRQLKINIDKALENGPVALMLSGGMDSAILASYLPEGTKTYTLHCCADSGIDETERAKYYADKNGLENTVVDIYWSDYEKYALPLMKQKGCPIHSIEVQIYKAAMQAKEDGIKTLIFGETADIIYGGHSKLLSRDWSAEEFAERFALDRKSVV